MFNLLKGPDVAELEQLVAERDAEIQSLQEQLHAHQEADQRDFLNDNSDQLAAVICTKNQVIQELQAKLQEQGGGNSLAHALESAATSTAEVQRLQTMVAELRAELSAQKEDAESRFALEAQSQESEARCKELEERCMELQRRVEENAAQAASAHSEVQLMASKAEAQLAAGGDSHWEVRCRELERQSIAHATAAATNAAEAAGKEAQRQNLEAQCRALESARAAEAAAREEEALAMEARCQALEERAEALAAEAAARAAEAAEKEARCRALEERTNAQATQSVASVAEQEARCRQLQQEADAHRAEAAARVAEAEEKEARFRELEQEAEAHRAAAAAKAAEATEKEARLRVLEEAHAAEVAAKAALAAEKEAHCSAYENKIAEHTAEAAARAAEMEAASLVRSSWSALEQARAELESQRLQLVAWEQDITAREKECSEREQGGPQHFNMAADDEVRQRADLEAEVRTLTDTVSHLTEALEQERERRAVEPRRSQLDGAEVERLKVALQAKAAENEALRKETADARRIAHEHTNKAQRLEHQLSQVRLDDQAAERNMHKVSTKGIPPSPMALSGGGIQGAIAGMLQDVELGERAGVTLVDLGLSEFAGLPEADKFLQMLSALMSVRADARLAVFGLWILCHLIYVIYLVYAHIVR